MSLTSLRNRTCVRTVLVGGLLLMGSIAAAGHAVASPLVPVVDSGGAGGTVVDTAWFQTANARSIALIESKEAPGGVLAGVPAAPSRIPYEESERAVAQHRTATTALAPHAESPNQVTY